MTTDDDCNNLNPVNTPFGEVGSCHCSTRNVGPTATALGTDTPSGTVIQIHNVEYHIYYILTRLYTVMDARWVGRNCGSMCRRLQNKVHKIK